MPSLASVLLSSNVTMYGTLSQVCLEPVVRACALIYVHMGMYVYVCMYGRIHAYTYVYVQQLVYEGSMLLLCSLKSVTADCCQQ